MKKITTSLYILLFLLLSSTACLADIITEDVEYEALINGDDSNFELLLSFTSNNRYKKTALSVGRLSIEFQGEPNLGSCTATVIYENYIITANHCLVHPDELRLKQLVFYLDYIHLGNRNPGIPLGVDPKPVNFDDTHDFAILRLNDTLPEGIKPLKLNPRKLQRDEELFILHHPKGGPLTLTRRKCRVRILKDEDAVVYHFCQTLKGSSGAPIFSDNVNFPPSIVAIHTHSKKIDIGRSSTNAGVPVRKIAEISSVVKQIIIDQDVEIQND